MPRYSRASLKIYLAFSKTTGLISSENFSKIPPPPSIWGGKLEPLVYGIAELLCPGGDKNKGSDGGEGTSGAMRAREETSRRCSMIGG